MIRLTPAKANDLIERGDAKILDVRRDDEYQLVHVNNSQHIPMHEIMENFSDYESVIKNYDGIWICMCHHGVRSARIATFLAEKNINNTANLEGGIDAWSDQIDQSLVKY